MDGTGNQVAPEILAVMHQAEKLLNDGMIGKGVELLSQLISEHPKTALAFVLRAQGRALQRNDADALSDYSTAVGLEPQNASHYTARGFFQLSRGNTGKAIDDFNQAIKIKPRDARPYNHRGMAFVGIGEVKKALDDFNQAIALDPKYVNAYNNRSFAYTKADHRKEALADLDRALELDPKSAGTLNNRGSLRLEDHDYENALKDFTRAVAIEGNNLNYLAHRRETYLKLERYAEAQADAVKIEKVLRLSALNDAILRNPRSPQAYVDRGGYCLNEGQVDNAVANFDRALELNSKDWLALTQRARARMLRGEFQQAVDDCTRALAIQQRDEPYSVRGDAYRKLGKFESALADYDASHRLDGEVAQTWLQQSQALRQSGHAKEAEDALKRANEFKALSAPNGN